jgi:hypothetical protein
MTENRVFARRCCKFWRPFRFGGTHGQRRPLVLERERVEEPRKGSLNVTQDRAHDGQPNLPPAHLSQHTSWVGSPTATANPEQPQGPISRSRKLVVAGLAGTIVLVAGVVLGTTLGHQEKHAHMTQDRFCDIVKKVEILGTLKPVVAPGGVAPADVPPLPTGSIATCTVKHSGDQAGLNSFYAAYKNGTDFSGYRAALEAHGFSKQALPGAPTTDPNRVLFEAPGRMIDILVNLGGVDAIQISEFALDRP